MSLKLKLLYCLMYIHTYIVGQVIVYELYLFNCKTAWYFCLLLEISLYQIGQSFGGWDHTKVAPCRTCAAGVARSKRRPLLKSHKHRENVTTWVQLFFERGLTKQLIFIHQFFVICHWREMNLYSLQMQNRIKVDW